MAKKPKQANTTAPIWVKVVCGIMGFLMIFSVVFMLLSSLQSTATETPGLRTQPDQQISVGLYCNENAVQSYTLLSDDGFTVNVSPLGLNVKLSSSTITTAVDGNLYRVGDQLYTESVGIATVGGYHIQISNFSFSNLDIDTNHDNPVFIRPGNSSGTTDGYTPANVNDYIELLSSNSTFKALNLPAFPYYASDQKCYIRVGSYFTQTEAESVLEQLQRTISVVGKVVGPDENTLTLLDKDFTLLCEFAGKGQSFELKSPSSASLVSTDGRKYNGSVFINRSNNSSANGLTIIHRLMLESYVSMLLSAEVPSTWDDELLKTMAVVLRTEITRKLGCHTADGFDICSESHCHVYAGESTVTKAITDAVSATAGLILTYQDKPIFTPYSLENGSSTISSADAFGNELPYLPAIYTPWEEAEEWTVEFTPFELYQLLNTAGYTEIQGNIESLQIIKRADGSDYVSSLLFTDIFGTSVTIHGSEAIRSLFAGRLPSVCFVAGRSGDTVNYTKRTLSQADLTYTAEQASRTLEGTFGSFVFVGSGDGCGVGLSIKGALALAQVGKTYEEILSIYFPGTTLTQ